MASFGELLAQHQRKRPAPAAEPDAQGAKRARPSPWGAPPHDPCVTAHECDAGAFGLDFNYWAKQPHAQAMASDVRELVLALLCRAADGGEGAKPPPFVARGLAAAPCVVVAVASGVPPAALRDGLASSPFLRDACSSVPTRLTRAPPPRPPPGRRAPPPRRPQPSEACEASALLLWREREPVPPEQLRGLELSEARARALISPHARARQLAELSLRVSPRGGGAAVFALRSQV